MVKKGGVTFLELNCSVKTYFRKVASFAPTLKNSRFFTKNTTLFGTESASRDKLKRDLATSLETTTARSRGASTATGTAWEGKTRPCCQATRRTGTLYYTWSATGRLYFLSVLTEYFKAFYYGFFFEKNF